MTTPQDRLAALLHMPEICGLFTDDPRQCVSIGWERHLLQADRLLADPRTLLAAALATDEGKAALAEALCRCTNCGADMDDGHNDCEPDCEWHDLRAALDRLYAQEAKL